MRVRSAFLAVIGVFWGLVQACGGDPGTDLDGGADATVDVFQESDTGTDVVTDPDTGADVADAGSDVTDASTGRDTGITHWTCGTAKVTDCAQCIGFTQPCVYCDIQDASTITGVCVQSGTNCVTAVPTIQHVDCACSDASTCPEAFQICTSTGRCHTCTDSTANDGLTCEDGTKCAVDAGCK